MSKIWKKSSATRTTLNLREYFCQVATTLPTSGPDTPHNIPRKNRKHVHKTKTKTNQNKTEQTKAGLTSSATTDVPAAVNSVRSE